MAPPIIMITISPVESSHADAIKRCHVIPQKLKPSSDSDLQTVSYLIPPELATLTINPALLLFIMMLVARAVQM